MPHEVPGAQNPLSKAPQSSSLPSHKDGALGQGAKESGQGEEGIPTSWASHHPPFLATAGSRPQAYSPAFGLCPQEPQGPQAKVYGHQPSGLIRAWDRLQPPGLSPLSCLSDLPFSPCRSQGAWRCPGLSRLPRTSPHGR